MSDDTSSDNSYPKCPKCSTELKEDFGITDCPGCGTVCFIDMNDNVTVKGDDDNEEDDDDINNNEFESDDEPEEDSAIFSEEEVEDSYGDAIEENLDLNSQDDHEEPEEFEAEDLAESDEVEDFESSANINELNKTPMAAGDFLNDLEVFASSSNVKDFESELYFDMKISGVESEEEKNLLIETVADSRLDLSEESLIEDYVEKEGALYLSQIPFVRAVVVYKRILSLGLKVEWLQKEVHELEAEDIDDDEQVENENY